MVPYKWGQLTSQKLREILPKHEFKSYKVTDQTRDDLDDDILVTGNDAFKQRGGDERREAVYSPVSAIIRKESNPGHL